MKKKNLLVGLLSTAFVLASAFAFGSCDDFPSFPWGDSSSEEHNWVSELTKPATCTEDGELTWTCSHCNEVKVDSVPALGHNFIDGVCECGITDVSQYFKYTLNEDGQSYSVGFFSSMEEVEEIIVSENIETEEDLIKYIRGNYPQTNVKGTLIIPSEYNGLPITAIRDGGFSCSSFDSVIIPSSITNMGFAALSYCKDLVSIEIPNSVTSIGISAFYNCSSLTSVAIGDSVTSIGEKAFYGCSSLTSIEIPDSVTSIRSCTFAACRSLTSVIIGDSVATIGDAAFGLCDQLTMVYYKGVMESWGEIDISSMVVRIVEVVSSNRVDISNENLTNTTVYYYSEEEPTTDGNYWHYDTDGVTPIVWNKEE